MSVPEPCVLSRLSLLLPRAFSSDDAEAAGLPGRASARDGPVGGCPGQHGAATSVMGPLERAVSRLCGVAPVAGGFAYPGSVKCDPWLTILALQGVLIIVSLGVCGRPLPFSVRYCLLQE